MTRELSEQFGGFACGYVRARPTVRRMSAAGRARAYSSFRVSTSHQIGPMTLAPVSSIGREPFRVEDLGIGLVLGRVVIDCGSTVSSDSEGNNVRAGRNPRLVALTRGTGAARGAP